VFALTGPETATAAVPLIHDADAKNGSRFEPLHAGRPPIEKKAAQSKIRLSRRNAMFNLYFLDAPR
jgi:hypothetical protein